MNGHWASRNWRFAGQDDDGGICHICRETWTRRCRGPIPEGIAGCWRSSSRWLATRRDRRHVRLCRLVWHSPASKVVTARTGESGMQKVQGFGGFFFRAQDPEGLASWYQVHLGIDPAPTNMDMTPWQTEAGVTVFSPFAADTDYFPTDKTFMLNFRVTDLDAMIAQLASAGIEVSDESEMEGIGRFARIHDPEGNAIELWEPMS